LTKKGFHAEHLFELQMPKLLLQTAYTGFLPDAGKSDQYPLRMATAISAENLFKGWHKLYPPNAILSPFYEVVKGMPKDWVAPPNTPAGRLMTVFGDWGNLLNMALAEEDINSIKGLLFSLKNPMGKTSLRDNLNAALAGNVEAAKNIETVFQNVS
jgi:chitinase